MTGMSSWRAVVSKTANDSKLPYVCCLVQGDTIQDIQQLFKGFSLPVRVDKLVRAVRHWRDEAVKDREQAATEGGAAEVKPEEESETETRPESGSGDKQQTESGNDGAKAKSEPVVDVRRVCHDV